MSRSPSEMRRPSDANTEHAVHGDDAAYLLPMGIFLAFTWAASHWESFYPAAYPLKALLTAGALLVLRRHYTRINWNGLWLGVLVGALVAGQWIGMEKLLLHVWPNYPRMAHAAFNPFEHFQSPAMIWSFIAVRWAGAVLIVPVMEELFWRDYLWRTLLAPSDFKLAGIGEWDSRVFIVIAVVFGAGVHVEWMTAIVCGLIYGALLVKTRSLGACIVAHAVTNFLLGAYVIHWHDWAFW